MCIRDRSTGDLCAAKVREVKTKGFMSMGDVGNVGFFGQQQCNRDTFITITEGELDALAIYEMSGKSWDVVSLRSGASNAAKEIKAQLEWLEGYEQWYSALTMTRQETKQLNKSRTSSVLTS